MKTILSEKEKSIKMKIPNHIISQLRYRKKIKGPSQQRNLEDALAFAFSEENKKFWF